MLPMNWPASEKLMCSRGLPQSQTRQVATDVQDALQAELVAGVDVVQLPIQVAQLLRQRPRVPGTPSLPKSTPSRSAPDVNDDIVHLENFWEVTTEQRKLVEQMILRAPESPEELVEAASHSGLRELFPEFSTEDRHTLAAEGQIPVHSRWGDKMLRHELAVDSLLTLASLAHFRQTQEALAQRLRRRLD